MIDISDVRPKSSMIIGRTVFFFIRSTFDSKKYSTFAENNDNSKF